MCIADLGGNPSSACPDGMRADARWSRMHKVKTQSGRMPGADAQKLPGWAQGGYPNRADAQTLPGWVQGGYPQSADAVEGECDQMDGCFE